MTISNGEEAVAIHAFHTVLKNELSKRRPQIGDRLIVTYHGMRATNSGSKYHALLARDPGPSPAAVQVGRVLGCGGVRGGAASGAGGAGGGRRRRSPAVLMAAFSGNGTPSPEGVLELVLEHVASAGVDLRESGTDRWRGDCVACGGEDRMVVQRDLNGHVSIRCWSATCSEQAVLEALGLAREALYPQREPARGRVTFATEVRAEPVRWLVPGRIPLGAVSLLAGDPKLGKCTLSCTYAAGVTLGKFGDEPATVLIITAEDSFARVIKPRAAAVGRRSRPARQVRGGRQRRRALSGSPRRRRRCSRPRWRSTRRGS